MVVEFKFPDVGEGIAEGEIVKWMVKEGDKVKMDQHMVDIETDKAVAEIPAPKSGTIVKIHHKEGEKVKVGTVIVTIAEEGENVSSVAASKQEEKKETHAPAHAPAPANAKAKAAGSEEHYTASVVGQIEQTEHLIERKEITQQRVVSNVKATPAVRMFAKQMDVDIEKVKGTGPGGTVTVDDIKKESLLSRNEFVRNVIKESDEAKEESQEISKAKKHQHEEKPSDEQPTSKEIAMAEYNNAAPAEPALQAVKKYDFFGYIEHVPLKGVRRAVANHLRNAADKAVMVTHMDEVDITDLAKARDAEKGKHEDFHLTFLPYIVKATIAALKEHPMLNSAMDDEKEEIIVKKYYNIGVAVDTPDGLFVPVIKEAQNLKLSEIAKEIERLAKAGSERKLDPMDMKGGSFSITNIGSIGGIHATPIINYPEAAILGLGRAQDKAMVINGEIVARKVLPFEVTFDHRVLDGAECAKFANKFKEELVKLANEEFS